MHQSFIQSCTICS